MEQIKKKLASLKQEKEDAVERFEEMEAQKKEADAKAEAVRVVGEGLKRYTPGVYCNYQGLLF
jgi:predicted nuclease with TOPRIM domain